MPEPTASDAAATGGTPGPTVARRLFLRQLTGEAVETTARVAGLSSMVRRSLVAAGESIGRDLGPSADEEPPSGPPPVPPPAVPASPPPPQSSPAVGTVARLDLTPEQHDVLALGSTVVLGVNDPVRGPHLTSSIYHWDGELVRVPSELFAARVASIEQDRRVSALVHAASSDAWLALSGVATIVSGDEVATEMLTILVKYLSDTDARRLWTELRSTGDRVVIQVRPTRLVWRSDDDVLGRPAIS